MGFAIFEREHQKKGSLKKKIEDSMYTLKIPFTLYTCVFAKVLQNGAKFIQKADSWFQKSQEFEQIQTRVESPKQKKLKFDGPLCKKYIPSDKTCIYRGFI